VVKFDLKCNEKTIRDNIDFIISHFEGQHELFPRSILIGEQRIWKIIDFYSNEQKSKDRIFESFRKYGFIDCRINAFPHITQHRIDFEVKNKTAASFIMIDLDLKDFDSKKRLDNQLRKTLNRLLVTFRHERFHGEAHPTVLWTGNGYHIYQPIEGMVLEKEKIFFDFLPYVEGHDMTTEFLRFAEKYFTNGKADPQHSPSVRSCLVRIPGTFNSKNNDEVKIIQRWNGDWPPIQCLTREFQGYLIQKRNDKIKERKKSSKEKKRYSLYGQSVGSEIGWIEKLLETPIEDYRKTSISLIIVPYLLVVKNLEESRAYEITKDWIQSCSNLRRVNLDIYNQIKYTMQRSKRKRIPPMKLDTIKTNRSDFHDFLNKRNVFR
jgi:hypothetical protein